MRGSASASCVHPAHGRMYGTYFPGGKACHKGAGLTRRNVGTRRRVGRAGVWRDLVCSGGVPAKAKFGHGRGTRTRMWARAAALQLAGKKMKPYTRASIVRHFWHAAVRNRQAGVVQLWGASGGAENLQARARAQGPAQAAWARAAGACWLAAHSRAQADRAIKTQLRVRAKAASPEAQDVHSGCGTVMLPPAEKEPTAQIWHAPNPPNPGRHPARRSARGGLRVSWMGS